ncbi:MAG: cytochrome c maturation protein CcmE [Kofleriaceae bacterium]
MQSNRIAKIALTAAVVLVAGFVVPSCTATSDNYRMVDQLIVEGNLAKWEGKAMRVHGFVVPGSIKEQIIDQETVRTFVLQKAGKKIRVFNRGPKPDTFKDEADVVATGSIVPSVKLASTATTLGVTIDPAMGHVVDATELSAKCPSKYEGVQPNKQLEGPSYQ